MHGYDSSGFLLYIILFIIILIFIFCFVLFGFKRYHTRKNRCDSDSSSDKNDKKDKNSSGIIAAFVVTFIFAIIILACWKRYGSYENNCVSSE